MLKQLFDRYPALLNIDNFEYYLVWNLVSLGIVWLLKRDFKRTFVISVSLVIPGLFFVLSCLWCEYQALPAGISKSCPRNVYILLFSHHLICLTVYGFFVLVRGGKENKQADNAQFWIVAMITAIGAALFFSLTSGEFDNTRHARLSRGEMAHA